jgi:prolipoprotein diacylglyceryltransferase
VCVLAGVLLGLWLSVRRARLAGLPTRLLLDAAAWAIPFGLLAARFVSVVGNWDATLQQPSAIWQPGLYGLSLWGALAGGGVIGASVLRRGKHAARLADATAPGIVLGIVVGRVGSFVDGQGQGRPTSLPWGMQYANPLSAVPDLGVPRHPAQLYDALAALAILALLVLIERRAHPAGLLFWTFLTLYALVRIGLQAVRTDASFLFGVPLDELLAVAALLAAVRWGWLPLLLPRLRRAPSVSAPPAVG